MQQPRQMYQDGSIMPRLNELGTDVSSAEQMLQEINQRLQSAESSLGEGGAMQQPASLAADVLTSSGITGGPQVSDLRQPLFDKDGFRLGDQRYGTGLVDGPKMALPGLTNQTPGGALQSPIALAIRGMAADGGMMGRQNYGLGSFVKKAVKGVTKGIKSIAKSDLGKAALLAAGAYGLGGGTFFGKSLPFLAKGGAGAGGFSLGNILPNVGGIMGLKPGKENLLANTLKVGGYGTLLGGALAGMEGEQEGSIGGERNVGALRIRLEKAYRELGYDEGEIPGLVDADLAEYTQGAGGYAEGGRIGYAMGDSAEDNAIQASGIIGLPLNQNPAGVTELDLRETGGFIPPVGVKEKEDDIPAMLSNNEFVFTADAVRGMGDGDVNTGAQRMYDMMKKLENGGRV